MPKLIFLNAESAGRTWELLPGRTTVGRSSKNNLVIAHDSLSANHCEFLVNGTEVIVIDHGSRNGTFVNGSKVGAQSEVKSGQTVRLGLVELRLQLDAPPDDIEEETTEVTAVHAYARSLHTRDQSTRVPINTSDSHEPVTTNDEGTIVMTASAMASVARNAPAPAPAQEQVVKVPRRKLAYAAIAIVVALLAWWLLR